MEENLNKVNITIAGRQYPLSLGPAQEEIFRLASHKIDETISNIRSKWATRDDQDILSIVVLQFASALVQFERGDATKQLLEDIKFINNQLEEYLNSPGSR